MVANRSPGRTEIGTKICTVGEDYIPIRLRVRLPEGTGSIDIYTGLARTHTGNWIYEVEPHLIHSVSLRPGVFVYSTLLPREAILNLRYSTADGDLVNLFLKVGERLRYRKLVRTYLGRELELTLKNLIPLPKLTSAEYERAVTEVARLGSPRKYPVVQLYHYWRGETR